MDLNRISVKFPVAAPASVHTDKLVPLFHRWIQEHAIEGVLVDVANYDHVPDGPGVMLIGDEGDHAIDFTEGKPQFAYTRKRAMPGGLRDKLRITLRTALAGIKVLQDNPAPHGPISIRLSEATISLIDRLHAPNNEGTWAKVRGDIEAVVSEVFGPGAKAEWTKGDARGNFNVRITAPSVGNVSTLLDRFAVAAGR
jgi:hypothetical protein